jgi:hypothetical protein
MNYKTLLKQTIIKAPLGLKEKIMENKTINFSVQKFRLLLNEKSQVVGKLLYDLEQLGNEQNKDVINKLFEERILTVVDNKTVPSGLKLNPDNGVDFTEEEKESNLKVLQKTSEIFMSFGGKNTVKIELSKLNNLLFSISNEDILNCVE